MKLGILAAATAIVLTAVPAMADGMLGDPYAYLTRLQWGMASMPEGVYPLASKPTASDSQVAQVVRNQAPPAPTSR
jgi:hypothetical protein